MIASNLTTKEIENHLDKCVLIPFGSFEQHGPYLPLITDAAIAEELSKKIESELPNKTLLYPCLWLGDSMEHKGFCGTLSMTAMTTMQMLLEMFQWINDTGFTRGILYNAHGGNVNLSATVCEEFSRANTFKIKSFFAFTDTVEKKTRELFGYSDAHAGSAETSLLYALRPDLKKTPDTTIENIEPFKGKFSYFQTKDLNNQGILNNENTIVIDSRKGLELSKFMVLEGMNVVNKMLSF